MKRKRGGYKETTQKQIEPAKGKNERNTDMETKRPKMYRFDVHYHRGTIEINQGVPGDKLESKIEALMHEHESTGEKTAPLLYTAREQGVKASTDIRTDRWEIAVEAATKVAKSYLARREERAAKAKQEGDKDPESGLRPDGKEKGEKSTEKAPDGGEGKE